MTTTNIDCHRRINEKAKKVQQKMQMNIIRKKLKSIFPIARWNSRESFGPYAASIESLNVYLIVILANLMSVFPVITRVNWSHHQTKALRVSRCFRFPFFCFAIALHRLLNEFNQNISTTLFQCTAWHFHKCLYFTFQIKVWGPKRLSMYF